jgi:hypothetical protein
LYHFGDRHEDYVQSRLEGYARNNPRKLEKILDELEKRRSAQKLYNLPFAKEITRVHPRPADFSLDIWREKIRDAVGTTDYTLDSTSGNTILDENETLS